MIQTDALQIIQAVARFGNFTTAARHLHKVPSAISYSVRKVEEQLGAQLFLRDSRRVELTPAGEYFINKSQTILDDLSHLSSMVSQISTGVEAELHIVVDNIVNQGPVQDLATAFQKEFPETTLFIRNEIYIGCWEALFDNQCQLAIGAPMNIPEEIHANSCFDWRTMGPLNWQLVMSPNHPLVSLPEGVTISVDDISSYTTLAVEDSARILHHGGDSITRQGKNLIMPSFRQALAYCASSDALCMVPAHFAAHWLASGKLITKPARDLPYNPECLMAWNKDNMGAALKWCLKWLGTQKTLTRHWLSPRPDLAALDIF